MAMAHFKPELNARAGPPSGWDAKNYLAFEPPMEFFTKPPKNLPAYFSTRMGTRPRRDPDMLPTPRRISPWDAAQIKEAADTIRTYCFPMFKHIEEPQSYYDLHTYWDSTDLWGFGVQNLWNVLQHLYWETQGELPGIIAEVRVYVEEWVGMLLGNLRCRNSLSKWNDDEDGYDILGAFQPEDLKDLDGLDMYWLPLVRDVLKCARGHIRRGTYEAPRPTPHKPVPSSMADLENNHGFAGSEWSFHTTARRPQSAVVALGDMGLELRNGAATKGTCVVDRSSATATKARRDSTIETASVSGSTPSTVVDKSTIGTEAHTHEKTPKASIASLGVPNTQNLVRPREEAYSSISRQNGLAVPPLTQNTIRAPFTTQVFADKPPNASGGWYTPDGQPNPWYYPRNSASQAPRVNGMGAPDGHHDFSSYSHAQKPRQTSDWPVGSEHGVSTTQFKLNGARAPVPSTYDNSHARSSNYPEYNGAAAYGPVYVKQGQNHPVKPQFQMRAPLIGPSQQTAPTPQAGHQLSSLRHEGTGLWPHASNRHQLTHGFHQVPGQQHTTLRYGNVTTRCVTNASSYADQPSVPRHWENPGVGFDQIDNRHRMSSQSFGTTSIPSRRDTTSSVHSISHDPSCLNAHRLKTDKDRTLYVGPFQPGELLSPESERKVFDAFSAFGDIINLTITKSRGAAFVRFKKRSSAFEAKVQLNGKMFDFCERSIKVNYAFGSQYYVPFITNRQRQLNNPTMNGFDIQGEARPAQMVAKNVTRAPREQVNSLLAKQHALVPRVNDVLNHMHHSSSADEPSEDGTAILHNVTLPGQDDVTQPAPKSNEDTFTGLDADSGSDKPVSNVRNVAMLEDSGETLAFKDKHIGDVSDPDVGHDAIVNEQEGQTTSQLSSRTITPSGSTPVSPTNNTSGQSSREQDDQSFNAEDRTLDYGTVRRYPNKRADRQPIPIDWAVPSSGSPGDAHQATSHIEVSPSRVHNPATFVIRSASSQDVTPQLTPHGNKSKKGKSKAKKNQQKLSEQSSSYMLPATAYQPADAAVSEQLPSQP
ncbi:hypothetical protein PG994_007622 [Apiospora phragmitis]|uniref:RRM domain-containing protein n=1 Tax=Apiospora phragmitis TaxID=2905665 RepID=A0ABR1UQR8_9PEZI